VRILEDVVLQVDKPQLLLFYNTTTHFQVHFDNLGPFNYENGGLVLKTLRAQGEKV